MLRGGLTIKSEKAPLVTSARGLGRRQTPAATKADPAAVLGRCRRRNCLRLHAWYLLSDGGAVRPWPTGAGRARQPIAQVAWQPPSSMNNGVGNRPDAVRPLAKLT